jgi:dipeptidyl aminopeptidase/acylaminoacyl peptidase
VPLSTVVGKPLKACYDWPMIERKIAPYGTWKSPISADLIAQATIQLAGIALDGSDVYWSEMRPAEGGRYVIVRQTPEGQVSDVTPPGLNARTRVHEYGGGAFTVRGGQVYFSHFQDNRLYAQRPGEEARPITPDGAMRYADLVVDSGRSRLICVREDHSGPGEAVNTLVAINLNQVHEGQVLVSGNDFYASPRLSPDGQYLAWQSWHHPNMPWDGCELWLARIQPDGSLAEHQLIAGGPEESIQQPCWSPDGQLYFISDRTNWWNLYRWRDGRVEPICPMAAEFGVPQWQFGNSTYVFTGPDHILCTYQSEGVSHLARLDAGSGQLSEIPLPYSALGSIHYNGAGWLVFTAASPTEFPAVVRLDLTGGGLDVLKRSSEVVIDAGYLSIPEAIECPTAEMQTAHAFYYAPANQDYAAPAGEKPPLIVFSHGGPTGATSSVLNLQIQFWTSRGFAVVDVNYGGSVGYGRAYRQRLNGKWGIVDVQDCINSARYLIERGWVDGNRLAIRGGSAGGYTTLQALTSSDFFHAGASYFGLSDLEIFVHDTHKFESRYLHTLIGPFPEERELYRERSPINHVDRLSCALLLLQGLEDAIVPPNQAELMLEAVRRKGLPVAYLPFEGEQHGFRRAENIKRALEAELFFYGKVFGFEIADHVEPVPIDNL